MVLTRTAIDERAARADLRRQIAVLERRLATLPPVPAPPATATGPRLLDLADLERTRDALAHRLAAARAQQGARAAREAEARALLERMRAQPARHKFLRLRAAELGQPGCGAYHVRPRLGLVGMLMGWWQVKLSSGCPLAC